MNRRIRFGAFCALCAIAGVAFGGAAADAVAADFGGARWLSLDYENRIFTYLQKCK